MPNLENMQVNKDLIFLVFRPHYFIYSETGKSFRVNRIVNSDSSKIYINCQVGISAVFFLPFKLILNSSVLTFLHIPSN